MLATKVKKRCKHSCTAIATQNFGNFCNKNFKESDKLHRSTHRTVRAYLHHASLRYPLHGQTMYRLHILRPTLEARHEFGDCRRSEAAERGVLQARRNVRLDHRRVRRRTQRTRAAAVAAGAAEAARPRTRRRRFRGIEHCAEVANRARRRVLDSKRTPYTQKFSQDLKTTTKSYEYLVGNLHSRKTKEKPLRDQHSAACATRTLMCFTTWRLLSKRERA